MATASENLAIGPSRSERLRLLLAEVDRLVGIGVPVARACRDVGLIRATYYRLKNENAPVSDNDGGSTNPEAGTNQQIQCDSSTSLPDAGGTGEPDGGN